MNTLFFRFRLISVALLMLICGSLYANTVMISYDVVVDSTPQLAESAYIRETSIDVESGVMDSLFDKGHIVFNAPGQVFNQSAPAPRDGEQETLLARRRLEAVNGGADIFIYMRLYFSGASEDDLELANLECQIYQLDGGVSSLAREEIQYARPDAFAVDGFEASRILLARLSGLQLF